MLIQVKGDYCNVIRIHWSVLSKLKMKKLNKTFKALPIVINEINTEKGNYNSSISPITIRL